MLELIVVLVCLFLNAILSGVEMAFVTVSKPRLRELVRSGNLAAKCMLALRENPERTLSVIQVGITLVGYLGAAVGGAGAQESIRPVLTDQLGLGESTAEILSILCVVIPLAYVSVVVGELVPKTLALRDPLSISLKSGKWLVLFDRILSPVVVALEWSTKLLLKVFFRKPKTDSSLHPIDTVELDQLSQQARQYVLNLVSIEKKRIKDVYLPWKEVIKVDILLSLEEVEEVILRSGHTRLPVTDKNQVVGILNTKEFNLLQKSGARDWKAIVRPPVQVQETDSLLRAFKLMQEKRSHLSIVNSGAGRTGIVTMEDILEEIIGEVYDEDDDGLLRRILSSAPALRRWR